MYQKLDLANNSTNYKLAAQRWLDIWAQLIGTVLVTVTCGFVLGHTYYKINVDPSLAGLTIFYSVEQVFCLTYAIKAAVMLDSNMISIERVFDYFKLPQETTVSRQDMEWIDSDRWPHLGAIQFRNLSTRYQPHLNLVLKNININIKPSEKVMHKLDFFLST